jgi:hypothetical protein
LAGKKFILQFCAVICLTQLSGLKYGGLLRASLTRREARPTERENGALNSDSWQPVFLVLMQFVFLAFSFTPWLQPGDERNFSKGKPFKRFPGVHHNCPHRAKAAV